VQHGPPLDDRVLRQVSVVGILAVGMTFVILTGGIDLSVGSLLGLCAVLFGVMTHDWHWATLPARPQ
jgi:ribose/xylose/arabinose/galactoside ABC-type transport system permease subunit